MDNKLRVQNDDIALHLERIVTQLDQLNKTLEHISEHTSRLGSLMQR